MIIVFLVNHVCSYVGYQPKNGGPPPISLGCLLILLRSPTPDYDNIFQGSWKGENHDVLLDY
jgi:hypothetical protein